MLFKITDPEQCFEFYYTHVPFVANMQQTTSIKCNYRVAGEIELTKREV